jgi:phage FluMu protein Com
MTLKVRIKCGRCKTVNVAITDIKGSPIRIR